MVEMLRCYRMLSHEPPGRYTCGRPGCPASQMRKLSFNEATWFQSYQ